MALLGLIIPFLAAGGWLWWIYQSDRFEKEPWPLVWRTFGFGAAAGLVALILLLLLTAITGAPGLAAIVLVPVHVAALLGVVYLVPYRRPEWNEPFDGLVYGGAAGIGYGLTYTLIFLFASLNLGFRSAMFFIPTFMLVGLIAGHYLSQVRFGPRERATGAWVRGFGFAALGLFGLELARVAGGTVMGTAHPLASTVVYGANTIGWILAMHAMDDKTRASQYNPENYRIPLAPTGCPHCGYAHPVDAAYCNWCGQPIAAAGYGREEQQG